MGWRSCLEMSRTSPMSRMCKAVAEALAPWRGEERLDLRQVAGVSGSIALV